MKISTLLLFLVTCHESYSENLLAPSRLYEYATLNEWFPYMIVGHSNSRISNKTLESFDLRCVKNVTQLTKNGDKILNDTTAFLLIFKGIFKCNEQDQVEFVRFFVDKLVNETFSDIGIEITECSRCP
jgi:hypothetical protein